MNNKKWIYFVCLLISIFFAGCSAKEEINEGGGLSLIKTTSPTPLDLNNEKNAPSIGKQLKEEIRKIDEIYDVAIIEGKEQVLVAYKVRHLDRFKMKKIEKKLTKRLEDKYPDKKFIVSSDYKIFLEVIRLKKEKREEKLTDKEAEKRFKKIIKLKKEMT